MDYEYFSKHYKLFAIDVSKQIQLEHLDWKQKIKFIGRLERNGGAVMMLRNLKKQSGVNITNYNVLIDGWNVYDQPINDQIKKYDEIRNTSTGQRDYYTTGCLLNYQ